MASELIERLKRLSNNYTYIITKERTHYVIEKHVLDAFIQELESEQVPAPQVGAREVESANELFEKWWKKLKTNNGLIDRIGASQLWSVARTVAPLPHRVKVTDEETQTRNLSDENIDRLFDSLQALSNNVNADRAAHRNAVREWVLTSLSDSFKTFSEAEEAGLRLIALSKSLRPTPAQVEVTEEEIQRLITHLDISLFAHPLRNDKKHHAIVRKFIDSLRPAPAQEAMERVEDATMKISNIALGLSMHGHLEVAHQLEAQVKAILATVRAGKEGGENE